MEAFADKPPDKIGAHATLTALITHRMLYSTCVRSMSRADSMTRSHVPFPAGCVTNAVMDFLGAIEAEADEEAIFMEQPAPVLVQQNAVGLEELLTDWPLTPCCC